MRLLLELGLGVAVIIAVCVVLVRAIRRERRELQRIDGIISRLGKGRENGQNDKVA